MGWKTVTAELTEFSGLGDDRHPLDDLNALSAHYTEEAEGQS